MPIKATARDTIALLSNKMSQIDEQIASLSSAVETLNKHNSYDLYIRAGTVIVTILSVLIAFILFYLNRKKEFHIKKSEIAGEIYSRIHEFKRLKIYIVEQKMRSEALFSFFIDNSHVPLDDSLVMRIKMNFGVFREEETNSKVTKSEEELNALRRELQKYIGQYRYFVGKGEKAALKFHSHAISQTHPIKMVTISKSVNEIVNSVDDVMEDAIKVEKEVIDRQFYALEGIIDNYKDYVKNHRLAITKENDPL